MAPPPITQILLHILPPLLPLLLLLPAFTLALLSTTSKDWAHQSFHGFDASGRPRTLLNYRSPTHHCLILPNQTESCALARCTPDQLGDNVHLCQLIGIAFHLLVAGDVFMGLAFVGALVMAVLGVVGTWKGQGATATTTTPPPTTGAKSLSSAAAAPDPTTAYSPASAGSVPSSTSPSWVQRATGVISLLLQLFLIAGVVTLVLAHLVGADALVNQQLPDGNFITEGGSGAPAFKTYTPWQAGVANAYLLAAWFLALLTLWLIGVLGKGRVGGDGVESASGGAAAEKGAMI